MLHYKIFKILKIILSSYVPKTSFLILKLDYFGQIYGLN